MTMIVHYGFDTTTDQLAKALGKPADLEDQEFVVSYVSHSSWKNITAAQVATLAALRKSVVLVWETTADRALAGFAAGVADARDALAQAKALGMPWRVGARRPIYFAIDFDTVRSDLAAIADYFRGVASVLTVRWTGVYGETDAIEYLRGEGLVSWLWQTLAWSGGEVAAYRNMYQARNGVVLPASGAIVDHNEAYGYDWGQWRPGWTPNRPKPHPPIPQPKLIVDGILGPKTVHALKSWLKWRYPKKTRLVIPSYPKLGRPTVRALELFLGRKSSSGKLDETLVLSMRRHYGLNANPLVRDRLTKDTVREMQKQLNLGRL